MILNMRITPQWTYTKSRSCCVAVERHLSSWYYWRKENHHLSCANKTGDWWSKPDFLLNKFCYFALFFEKLYIACYFCLFHWRVNWIWISSLQKTVYFQFAYKILYVICFLSLTMKKILATQPNCQLSRNGPKKPIFQRRIHIPVILTSYH